MPIARHLGLRGRLILLLLAAFAVIFAMVVQHVILHRAEQITDATAHLLDKAKLIAARQRHIAARAETILNGLMLRPKLRPGASAAECSRILAAQLGQEPEFIQIGEVLPNGDILCSAAPVPGRVNFADRSWFRQALKSEKMVTGDMVTGRIIGKPVITLAKAMRDDAGHPSGVLYVSIDLSWLHKQLAQDNLPEGARLTLVDGRGTVVVRHPDPEGWTGKNATHLSLFKTILASGGEGTLEETGLDGVRKMYAFTPLLETVSGRMVLYLSMPVAAITAPAQHELVVSLLAATTVLLLVLTLMYWGSETLLVRPLLALSRTIARFGSGDHAARCGPPYSDDEVGRLARTVDEVAETTQSNERKLARANHALRVRSAGNLALLRAKGEQDLLEEMCRVIAEAGGYRVVWVGYAKHDRDKSVRPVASWNAAEDFFDGPKMTWDETDSGRGPIGAAIRRGIAVVSNSALTDPDYAWALRYGIASTLALPLRLDSAVIGALCICAAEPDAFDEVVIELFSEFANDLAAGIAAQRAEAEHERTRAELKRQEERNTLILNAAGEGIFGLDNAGRCTFINPAGAAMLQWTAEELAGQSMHALHHHTRADGTPYPRDECPIYAAYKDGIIHRGANELFWRKDGTSFPVEYVSTPISGERGKPVGAVVTFDDITERKQAEEDLKREIDQHKALAHKLQETEQQMIQSEKMAAVGTLAAGVAHEINNPASYVYSNVVTLRGYIQRLMRLLDTYEKAGTLLPEEMRQAAEELESVRQQVNVERVKADLPAIIAETLEGIDRIIRIVGDLKDFSHLDVEESWQPADLNQALDSTLSVVWNELKYKAEIHKEYGVLPPVTCLVFQLNQVFMNLLVNAGQAIGEHGVITLRTGVAGEEVWVEIADTGRGIPQQHLSRIFEPFFTTKPAGSGTGLGLWISHGIVEKHKGRIEVVSEEGVGTTFKVWLPVHPVAES